MSSPDADTCLYIAHVASRLSAMEERRERMNPLAYRVLARRMRQAAAGLGDELLRSHVGPSSGPLAELLENRHFNEFGRLPGPAAVSCAKLAADLLNRCRERDRPASE
jgi:hypothetical protein